MHKRVEVVESVDCVGSSKSNRRSVSRRERHPSTLAVRTGVSKVASRIVVALDSGWRDIIVTPHRPCVSLRRPTRCGNQCQERQCEKYASLVLHCLLRCSRFGATKKSEPQRGAFQG